jgi:diacylglycerol kinase family enzyme
MKLLVLVNEAARGLRSIDRKELSVRLLRGFNEAGAEAYVHCIDAPALLREAREAMESDVDGIIVGGGDGIVAEVINAAASSYKPVGVLPLGVNNHFARQLDVPLDLDRAVAALANGHIGDVTVGELNGRVFLNFAAVGLPDEPAALANESWLAMLKRVVGLNDRKMRVRSRGHTLAPDALTVIACNNAYSMALLGVPASAAPEPGLLNVYVARPSRPQGIARVLSRVGMKIFNGAPPPFSTMALPEIRIESSRKTLEVSIDGDVWAMRPPLHISPRERALRVLLPGDAPVKPPEAAATRTPPAPEEIQRTVIAEGLELEPEARDTAHP